MSAQPLVYIDDGEAWCDSVTLAAQADKRHDHVLRDIDAIVAEEPSLLDKASSPNLGSLPELASGSDLSRLHGPRFREALYEVARTNRGKRAHRKYEMNSAAFALLMGRMTGRKPLKFQITYTTAFETMRAMLATGAANDAASQVPERTYAERLLPDQFSVERRRTLHAENKRIERYYGEVEGERHWRESGLWHPDEARRMPLLGNLRSDVQTWFGEDLTVEGAARSGRPGCGPNAQLPSNDSLPPCAVGS